MRHIYAPMSWEWIKEKIKCSFSLKCPNSGTLIFYTPQMYVGYIKGIVHLHFPYGLYVEVVEDNTVKRKSHEEC